MRRLVLTLATLFVAAPAALTQTPPPANPAPPPALPPALANHLNAWEARQKRVKTLQAECELVKKNLIHRKEKASAGSVKCMKPNMARLELRAKGDPTDTATYLCDGRSVFDFQADRKLVTEYPLPKDAQNGFGDNILLEFVSGSMTAADAGKRFDLVLAKEEEWYVHIEAKPRLARDRQQFESVLLVLYGPKAVAQGLDYLPKVVVLRNNSGQAEEHWTFTNLAPNSDKVTAEQFKFAKPDGWTLQSAPAPGAPARK